MGKYIKPFAVFLLIILITGCNNKNMDINNSESINSFENRDNSEPIVYENEIKHVQEENKQDTNTSILYEGITYQIIDVQIGKEVGNHKKEDFTFWTKEVDEEGNLTGFEQYIWVTLNVKNTTNEEKEILVNYPIVWISSDNVVIEAASEAIYLYPNQGNRKPQEKFHCILKGGEEKQIEIGYLLFETNPKDSLYFCLGNSGSELDNSNNIFLYLGEVRNEK